MKRNLLPKSLKRGLLAVPAAAMMLGASHGAQIGINIQTWWPQYGGPTPGLGLGYQTTGWPVTAPAFGLDVSEWTSTAPLDGYSAVHTNVVLGNFPSGSRPTARLDAQNPWASGIGWTGGFASAATVTPGDDEVTWGYLDDTGSGPQITISGLRAIASDYTIQTIAAIGAAQDSFPDVTLTTMVTNIQILDYTNGTYAAVSGTVGTSTVSTVYTTLNGNDSIIIKAGNRDSRRSTIAGVIVRYTLGGNPPLIEVNPQPPAGQVFVGDSFSLSAVASGTPTPTFGYQWRKGGINIPGAAATFANYTNTSAPLSASGFYDVVVENAFGRATSTVAQVTILNVTSPLITKAPVSQSLYQSYPATFSVEATGGKLAFQWKTNAVAIPNATNSTYSIASVTANSAGTYSVDVSNPVGPTATAAASLTVTVPTPGSYEAVVAQTKPALWLRYSETGVVAQDTAANSGSLGAAGTGLYFGSVQQLVTGALVGSTNKAATLSGGKISVPYDAALNPAGPFSVDCWIKPTASGYGLIVQEMINGENPNNANDRTGWALRLNNTGLRFYVGTDTGAPFYYFYNTADGVITPGVWQHVAVVYNDVVLSIYINGVLAAVTVTRADNVALTQPEIDAIRITPNFAAPLIVGDRGYGGWAYAGSVDEVAIYPSALTSPQVLAHYQNGTNVNPSPAYNTLVTSEGAVEYLRLNDPVNLSPATNSGTWGAAWTGTYNDAGNVLGSPMIAKGAAGPRPTSYPGFESNNTAVAMTNGFGSSPVFGITTDHLTVTCWINRDEVFSTGDLSWLAWVGAGGMHLNDDTSPTPGELRYHWDGTQWDWGSGLIVPANVWTFCAMVLEPTQVTFYMSDGNVLRKSGRAAVHTPHLLNTPPGFGGGGGGSAARNYIGQLDESTFYDRALTQSEISALFMVGTGAPLELGLVTGGIIEDSKPIGTPHNGANYLTTWLATSPGTPVTRTGVEKFIAATNSQITVPATPDFDSTTGTLSLWMRVPVDVIPGPGEEGAILVDRRTDNGMVIVLTDAGTIFVQCAGGADSLTSGSSLVDDNWHFVTVTYNQASGAPIEIYIDGALSASQANTSARSWPTAAPVELGRSHDNYWKRFNGQMDDFRIYDRVLTQPEIASIYGSDALVDTAALKLRFNFSTSGIGLSITWPFGTLLSSPTVGPTAIWTPVPGAEVPVYPFMPTGAGRFFRATP